MMETLSFLVAYLIFHAFNFKRHGKVIVFKFTPNIIVQFKRVDRMKRQFKY